MAKLRDHAAAILAVVPQISDEETANRVNLALMSVSRAMVPMDYTTGDRFVHDPALPQMQYPVLDPLRQLAATEIGSDQAYFLTGGARRACNRLARALDEANGALEACLADL